MDALIEPYLDQIVAGEWDADKLIEEIYFHNAGKLLKSYEAGYEKTFFSPDWGVKDNNMLNRVQNNLFAFSGAKTYSQLIELRDAVYENGKLLPRREFRERARKINATYNLLYLEVEQQNVMTSGTQASRWIDAQETADTHPYLIYVTKKDSHVREEHRVLEGIILFYIDPFWDLYYPPNGWRCRCSTRKLTQREYQSRMEHNKGTTCTDSEEAQKKAGKVVAKPFRHNVGKTEIFDRQGHPYFKANQDAKEMQLSAVKNYGMKPVKKIYEHGGNLSKYKEGIENTDDYRSLWEKLEKKYGTPGKGFTLIDKKNNISAHFDGNLMNKIADKGRWNYFDEIKDLMYNPDELWATWQTGDRFKNECFNVYVKYYQDQPIVMLVDQAGRVDSFYKWEKSLSDFEKFRTGLLKNRK